MTIWDIDINALEGQVREAKATAKEDAAALLVILKLIARIRQLESEAKE